jgi:glutaminase
MTNTTVPAGDRVNGQELPAGNGTIAASPIQQYLDDLHAQLQPLRTGAVADYIPELARADPEWFGIAIVTVDGHVYQVGDTRVPFTIQSISKPLVYGIALEDCGLATVLGRVGVEPSGEAFNSISLDPGSNRPLNPMINAGAIATAGLVQGRGVDERLARVLERFSRYAGHALTVDDTVYRSERDTGHRNRAICHMLRNFGMLPDPPEEALDLYFRQCSILVDCRDLALMAATLANNGVNPITGVVALKSENVERLLSVMTTCGMYDYAGSWIYEVGMPAKSGVGGGILAVLPGQLGIGVFSPRLDAKGNSVRGIETCRRLSQDFRLHVFNGARSAPSVIRARYDGTSVRSTRLRDEPSATVLDEAGAAISVYELHGDLVFGTAEIVVSELLGRQSDVFILDMKRVFTVDAASVRLFADLCRNLNDVGKFLFFTYTEDKYAFVRDLRRRAGPAQAPDPFTFGDNDHALEWAENRLLAQPHVNPSASTLGQQELLRGLVAEELRFLHGLLAVREFAAGQQILRQDDHAEEIYFIETGEVSVSLPVGTRRKRLIILAPGMAFGELGLIESAYRSADVHAETATRCQVLTRAELDAQPGELAAAIRQKLLVNLNRLLARNLRAANSEIRALA